MSIQLPNNNKRPLQHINTPNMTGCRIWIFKMSLGQWNVALKYQSHYVIKLIPKECIKISSSLDLRITFTVIATNSSHCCVYKTQYKISVILWKTVSKEQYSVSIVLMETPSVLLRQSVFTTEVYCLVLTSLSIVGQYTIQYTIYDNGH